MVELIDRLKELKEKEISLVNEMNEREHQLGMTEMQQKCKHFQNSASETSISVGRSLTPKPFA